MRGCPTRDVLVDFLSDRLAPSGDESIVAHVVSCEHCELRLETLSDDPTLHVLRNDLVANSSRDAEAASLVEEFLRTPPGWRFPDARRNLSANTAEPCLPRELGRYRLLSVIGSGGMGVVYRAMHTELGRPMAIKLLPAARSCDGGFAARFRREMRAIGGLQHANIVLAHDAGEIEGTLYLAMELVEGSDLEAIVRGRGRLAVHDACDAVRQAAAGIAHAHANGVIHRDVKPSNLLVASDGTVKVGDLGLARLAGPEADALSGASGVIGTLDYLAPEQIESPESVDDRCDLYGLGCVLFRLLAGRPPFRVSRDEPAYASLMRRVLESPPPVEQFRSDVPDDLARLVAKLLARDPRDRPQSALEVSQALAPFSRGAALAALVAECRERRAVANRGATDNSGALRQTIVLEGSTASDMIAVAAARPASRSDRSKRRIGLPLVLLIVVGAGGIGLWSLYSAIRPDVESELASAGDAQSTSPESASPRRDAVPSALVGVGVFEDFKPHEVPTGVWHPLLNRPPEEILWRPSEYSNYRFDPHSRRLYVNCDTAGMLSFGSYVLRLDIYQNQWTGGVGLFFGCHEEEYDGAPAFRFHSIMLDRNVGRDRSEFPYRLVLSQELLLRSESRIVEAEVDATASVPTPALRAHEIEVTVSRGQISRVRWGGNEVPQLFTSIDGVGLPSGALRGQFGSRHVVSDSNISNVRIRLAEEERSGRSADSSFE
ncbi:MAG: serine/threonine-protein kinase [Planctomycetaceae bacterium]